MTTLALVPADVVLEELLGHIGAAKAQLIFFDDRIISEHIVQAHALALCLFRSQRNG